MMTLLVLLAWGKSFWFSAEKALSCSRVVAMPRWLWDGIELVERLLFEEASFDRGDDDDDDDDDGDEDDELDEGGDDEETDDDVDEREEFDALWVADVVVAPDDVERMLE